VPIPIRSPRDIDEVRRAGAVLHAILEEARTQATPGARTGELAELIRRRIVEHNAEPVFELEGDPPFPAAAAITVNEEAMHAPPGARVLRDGDVATIDAGLRLGGWCVDAAMPLGIGSPSPLADAAFALTGDIIELLCAGRAWEEIAIGARRLAEGRGVRLVEAGRGHGIGRSLHEPPALDFGPGAGGAGLVLLPGMVLAIEPVVTSGSGHAIAVGDGWTLATSDRAPACHREHTVAITRRGPCILTAP
jgi:methionyl aminopeptidase